MSDHFIETHTTSWGGRIAGAIKGILFGLLLFVGAFIVIWVNEGRSVKRAQTLSQGEGTVQTVASTRIDPSKENALIHISGQANPDGRLRDSDFGIDVSAIKLKRNVEMYQWQETSQTKTKKNLGGSETRETTYSYSKVWSSEFISSSNFKKSEGHINPGAMPYQSKTSVASKVTIDAYTLSQPLINKISAYTAYPVEQANLDKMTPRAKRDFKVHGNDFFQGNPNAPEIGDLKVTYEIIQPQIISTIGRQSADQIVPYITKKGKIALVETGLVPADAMFSMAQAENKKITWALRLGGFLLMWFGLMILFAPFKVLGDVVPFIGSIVGAGISVVTGLVAIVLSLLTIAIAWLFYRPVLAVGLLVLAGLVVFAVLQRLKKTPLLKSITPVSDNNSGYQPSNTYPNLQPTAYHNPPTQAYPAAPQNAYSNVPQHPYPNPVQSPYPGHPQNGGTHTKQPQAQSRVQAYIQKQSNPDWGFK